MSLHNAKRGNVPPFMVMDVMNEAARLEAKGRHVIHMEVGQPSTPAPSKVREAAKKALSTELLGYTLALGMPALRARIARYYYDEYQLDIDPERIAVTTGSLGAFQLLFMAVFEIGERVVLPRPCYPSYRNMLGALGIETLLLPTSGQNGFQPTIEDLQKIDGKIDGLILASPSNPVGSMVTPEALKALAEYCQQNGIRLISDEIYHGLSYEIPCVPAVKYSDVCFSVNSFSKYFSMTGWRLGWMVMPVNTIRQIERLAQNFFICPSAVAQSAAIVAFDCTDELQQHVAKYARNRELLLQELPKAGFDQLAPANGAFYIYADISRFSNNSLEFAARMLEETGVAATSGVDFDPIDGHRFIRFSYARNTEDMLEAAQRLQAWEI